MKKKNYHGISDGCPQIVYILCFGRLDPHGREITKYWVAGHFGLGWPLALREILSPGRKRKTQFPGAMGPETEKKSYHAIRGWLSATFYVLRFGRPDPWGREITKYRDLRPFWPRTAFGT